MSGLGEILALLTAASWSVALVLFRQSGRSIPPLGLNLFKNVVGSACFLVTLGIFALAPSLRGWPTVSMQTYLWLILSGVLGLAVADTLLFSALNRVGAGRAAIIECLYSPFVIVGATLLLDEHLAPLDLLGGLGIVVSVLLSTRPEPGESPETARQLFVGIGLGALSTACLAVSIIMIKHILEQQPLLWVTTVRMVAGTASLALTAALVPRHRNAFAILRPQPAWRVAVPAGFLGTYVAIWLWLGGFKYASASVVSLLNQTSTLFTVVLATWLLREPLVPRRVWAALLAFAGSILVLA